MLRSCMGVSIDVDELARLMQVLFLEQRSGLRKTLKQKDKTAPPSVFKAYVIRMHLWVHLGVIFPRLVDVVELHGTPEHFKQEYG